ncbi:4,5-dihydroxyphthalate decarboxylase [Pseudomonas agarici]|uniref:4,5-dihydroxyphthalate decarboxylase n=1 Tax=Pseudomonas agarici TaxID=46677 RepID=A0A0X1SZ40_PSEAA|nr:hypothetical protein [Pseudomonas agarici]AMB85084.1 4,5-dihydroxyphthalate decarboxylase [Pseudomonas agarici]
MSKLNLSLACWDYDRTRALMDGTVRPGGIELNYLNMPVEETFFRMLRHHEFDVAEMSLSSYTMSLFSETRPFVAIPVFPSRYFRHSSIYINARSGIKTPKDLIGKRIGTPEYQMTAPLWIRGMLADEYQVPIDSALYLIGGEETPNRPEKLRLDLPESIRTERIRPDQTLAKMLLEGEIDALYTARAPSSFYDGSGRVLRLFEDYSKVELDYYRKTRIFPIMHCVVIRREVYEQNRWVAQSLFKAFKEAKEKTYQDMHETAAHKMTLPWLSVHVEQARRELGNDFWSYGLSENRDTIATFLRYHHEQGLSKCLLSPEDLFVPETFESFVI